MKKTMLMLLCLGYSAFAEVSRVDAVNQCQQERVGHTVFPVGNTALPTNNLRFIYASANPERFYELKHTGLLTAFRMNLNRKNCVARSLGVGRNGRYQFLRLNVTGVNSDQTVQIVSATATESADQSCAPGSFLQQETVDWDEAFEAVQERAQNTLKSIQGANANLAQTWVRAQNLLYGCSDFLTSDERAALHQLARRAATYPCRDGKYLGQGGECIVPTRSTPQSTPTSPAPPAEQGPGPGRS